MPRLWLELGLRKARGGEGSHFPVLPSGGNFLSEIQSRKKVNHYAKIRVMVMPKWVRIRVSVRVVVEARVKHIV